MQTFTWEGMPDGVALETLTFEDLGDGRTRLHAQSLCDSFEGRDAWLRSGMEVGVDEGYAKLDGLLAAGEIAATADGAGMTLPATRPSGTARSPPGSPPGCGARPTGTRRPRSPAGAPATWSATWSSGSRPS